MTTGPATEQAASSAAGESRAAREPSQPPAGGPRLFEALVELASDQIALISADGRTLYANAAARERYGADPAASSLDWVHPDDVPLARAAGAALRATPGAKVTVSCRLRTVDGGWAHVESVGRNLLHDPDVRGLLYLTRDVTERVRAERERERQLAGQQLVAELGLRTLRGCGLDLLAESALRGLRTLLGADHVHLLDVEADGLRVRHAVGTRPVERGLILPAACVAVSPAGLSLAQRGPVVVADLAADPDVAPPPTLAALGVTSSLVVLLDGAPDPTGALAVHTVTPHEFSEGDVAVVQAVANVLAGAAASARRETEARHQAMHDPLTGLANRVLLEDRTTKALQRSERDGSTIALLFIDLDGFKAVNDTHGHAAGDVVLAVLAGRLQALFRSADSVARLGGDEFVVLCADFEGPEEAELLRSRIADLWRDPVVLPPEPGGRPVHVTLSGTVGIATARGGGTDAAGLLARADAEMYRRKRRGG